MQHLRIFISLLAKPLIPPKIEKNTLTLHYINFTPLTFFKNQNYFLRSSPSGDTDITVLTLSLIAEGDRHRVYYDFGNGKNRKDTWLSEVRLSENYRSALIGFHSFIANDYVSEFFKKGSYCAEKR